MLGCTWQRTCIINFTICILIMKTALLLIDIQNDYFENGLMQLSGSEKASVNARKILKLFRTKNLPIVHIQHLSTRPGSAFFLPNTIGAAIHENVMPQGMEEVIVKHFPNSFRETVLLDKLKELEVNELVICGMMTHMCIDATTRAAKDFGFNCTLIGDACASKDMEIHGHDIKAQDVHDSFLAALNYFYAKVIDTNIYLVENP